MPRAAPGLGHGLVHKGFYWGASEQQQNPGPRVRPGWRAARPAQGVQGRPLVIGYVNSVLFAHVLKLAQMSETAKKSLNRTLVERFVNSYEVLVASVGMAF